MHFKTFRRKENPLLEAVIHDDIAAVNKWKDSDWREQSDLMGFTPLEIAQYLGRKECIKKLGDHVLGAFKVRLKGMADMAILSEQELEDAFKITYRPNLRFGSYAEIKKTVDECPYLLRCRWLVEENHLLAKSHQKELSQGIMAKTTIQWIDDFLGYGLFLDEDLPRGHYIGEYTGVVRQLFRDRPDHNAYCFAYPTKLWNRHVFMIDALKEGSLMRFCNHSEKPNLDCACAVDRNLLHQILLTNRPLKKGAQLTFDYGQEYWEWRDVRENTAMTSKFNKLLTEKRQ